MGKTTLARQKIRNSIHPAMVLTFKRKDYRGLKNKHGVEVEIYSDLTQFLILANKRSNWLMVIDEGETYLPDEIPRPWMDRKGKFHSSPLPKLFGGAREYNRCIYVVFHNWVDFKMWLMQYHTGIYRLNTQDMLSVQATRFRDFPNVVDNFKNHPIIKPLQFSYIPGRRQ